MKEANRAALDFSKFLLIVGIHLCWVILGTLVCGFWEGISLLPEQLRGTEIRGLATEAFSLIFWCYLPLITPFGKTGDLALVAFRRWIWCGEYHLKNLAQERTFFRLAGIGYAFYFAFRPIVHSQSEFLNGPGGVLAVCCLMWFLVSLAISYYLHRDVPPDSTTDN